jgi:hypothetical protein
MVGVVVPAAASAVVQPRLSLKGSSISYTAFGWKNRAESIPLTLRGSFTGAPAGAKARLLSKPFPFTGARRQGQLKNLTVSKGTADFAFTVQPQVATEYFVELLNANGTVNDIFQVQTVYVVSTRNLGTGTINCVGNTCHVYFTIERFLPTVVSTYELAKPYHDYLGVAFSAKGGAPAPTVMDLVHGWTQSKTTAMSTPDEYRTTFHFSFHLNKTNYSYHADACTIDSEAKDGFGLPGHHGCGNAKVAVDTTYLG